MAKVKYRISQTKDVLWPFEVEKLESSETSTWEHIDAFSSYAIALKAIHGVVPQHKTLLYETDWVETE